MAQYIGNNSYTEFIGNNSYVEYTHISHKVGDSCDDNTYYYDEYYDDNGTDFIDYYATLAEHSVAVTKMVHNIAFTYLPPILLVIGTLGNIFSFYVFWQPTMRKSLASWFFRVLAVVDTLCLHYGLLTFYVPHMMGYDLIPRHMLGCKIENWLKYVFPQLSAWVLVLLTVERLIGVTWPHKAKQLCTKQRAIACLIAIFTILLSLNFTPLIIEEICCGCYNGTWQCQCCTDLANPFVIKLQNIVQPVIDILLMSMLPFIIMISCNIMIIYKAFFSQRLLKVNKNNPHLVTMTVTLILVVFVFILLTAPFCAYSIARMYITNKDHEPTIPYLQVFYLTVGMLRYVNNSINFFLYALSGRPFRMEIMKIFCHVSSSGPKYSAKSSVTPGYQTRKTSGTSLTKLSYTVL